MGQELSTEGGTVQEHVTVVNILDGGIENQAFEESFVVINLDSDDDEKDSLATQFHKSHSNVIHSPIVHSHKAHSNVTQAPIDHSLKQTAADFENFLSSKSNLQFGLDALKGQSTCPRKTGINPKKHLSQHAQSSVGIHTVNMNTPKSDKIQWKPKVLTPLRRSVTKKNTRDSYLFKLNLTPKWRRGKLSQNNHISQDSTNNSTTVSVHTPNRNCNTDTEIKPKKTKVHSNSLDSMTTSSHSIEVRDTRISLFSNHSSESNFSSVFMTSSSMSLPHGISTPSSPSILGVQHQISITNSENDTRERSLSELFSATSRFFSTVLGGEKTDASHVSLDPGPTLQGQPEWRAVGGPGAMPAKRAGATSRGATSRAEDRGRLIEPTSSREDDDSPRSNTEQADKENNTGNKSCEPRDLQATETVLKPEEAEVTTAEETTSGATNNKEVQDSKDTLDPNKPSRSRSGQTVGSDTTGTSGGKRSQGGAGRSPTRGQPRQKVVYYQNRFITIPIDDGRRGGSAGSTSIGSAGSRPVHTGNTSITTKTSQGQQPNMDLQDMPIDLDPITPAQPVPRFGARGLAKTQSLFTKVTAVLQDNRLKSGSDEMKEQIKEMNKNQSESHKVLKKILNIIFITTGVSLFIAVVAVIIYTSIETSPPAWWDNNRRKREGQDETKTEETLKDDQVTTGNTTSMAFTESMHFKVLKEGVDQVPDEPPTKSPKGTPKSQPSPATTKSPIARFLNRDKGPKSPVPQIDPSELTPLESLDTLDTLESFDYTDNYDDGFLDHYDYADLDDRIIKPEENLQVSKQYANEPHKLEHMENIPAKLHYANPPHNSKDTEDVPHQAGSEHQKVRKHRHRNRGT